jgi:transcriptional regulator with XRE-family HTH domain
MSKSPNGVAKELGIPSGTVTWWKKGKVPHQPTLEILAAYFGVSVGYLLGYEVQEKNNDTLSDIVVRLRQDDKFYNTTKMLYDANDEQLNIVNSMLIALEK